MATQDQKDKEGVGVVEAEVDIRRMDTQAMFYS